MLDFEFPWPYGQYVKNEHRAELLSHTVFSPYYKNNSAARLYMESQHLPQHITLARPELPRHQTGMERKYGGEYTFQVAMPETGTIVSVKPRYMKQIDGGIKKNPETLVIYQTTNGVYDCFILKDYFSKHSHFGCRYIKTDAYHQIKPGVRFKKGTVFLRTPTNDEHGNYSIGLNLVTVAMSHPGVAEDGVIISESTAKRFTYHTYETRTISFGRRNFPLNLYGKNGEYKVLPDIGESVTPFDIEGRSIHDGLLMALRNFDEALGVVHQHPANLHRADIFDERIYAAGPGGKVVDIFVHQEKIGKGPFIPDDMAKQLTLYNEEKNKAYVDLIKWERSVRRQLGDNLVLGDILRSEILNAMNYVGKNSGFEKETIRRTYKRKPLDEFRVNVVIEYENRPAKGYKLTNLSGGKGVIVDILPDNQMPLDPRSGKRADIIVDNSPFINRMIAGVLVEQGVSASGDKLVFDLRKRLGLDTLSPLKSECKDAVLSQQDLATECFVKLMEHYAICNHRVFEMMRSGEYLKAGGNYDDHLIEVLHKGTMYFVPTDTERETIDLLVGLKENFPPSWGPIEYTDYSGKVVTTEANILMGSVYYILLDKTTDSLTATSSCPLGQFGIVAKLTKQTKHLSSLRLQPVKTVGEAESALIINLASPYAFANMVDLNTNSVSHRESIRNRLRALYPSCMEHVIERAEIPMGQAQPLQITKHILQCAGIKFVYDDMSWGGQGFGSVKEGFPY